MYKRVIKGIPRYVFKNEEEFKKSFPDTEVIKDWREGEENDWVLTDDGKVTRYYEERKNEEHYLESGR